MPASPWTKVFASEMEFERAFVEAGGLLLAGADPTGQGGVPAGFGDQREVELLVPQGLRGGAVSRSAASGLSRRSGPASTSYRGGT
jgi:hypothetical protein